MRPRSFRRVYGGFRPNSWLNNEMALENSAVGFQISLIILPSKVTAKFDLKSRYSPVVRVDFEFNEGRANLHAESFFPSENCLVLEPRKGHDMDVAVIHVIADVIMSLH